MTKEEDEEWINFVSKKRSQRDKIKNIFIYYIITGIFHPVRLSVVSVMLNDIDH